ncbi:hypothetical protein AAEO50_06625 [Rossellomorea oryzaecorticis]|uniref:Ethanolamine utilization protein n=1 Tax=Rossellomorea oryzaecorticis TaxID=1396505 RepID=A0ABU9K854_9BACI
MIDRELVEQIVIEVLKTLNLSEIQPENHSNANLLMIGDKSRLEPDHLSRMESRWNLISCESLEQAELHTAERVMFLDAPQDLIVKGALGIGDTPESELLSRCILEYVPVTIIPKTHLNKHLFNEYQQNSEYIKQLNSYTKLLLKFGVKVEALNSFLGEKNEEKKQSSLLNGKSKQLLTQRDIQDHKEEEVQVTKQTIITPLARDAARELGKRIIVIE